MAELPGQVRYRRTGRFTRGLKVSEVLGLTSLNGATLVAGASGVDREVQRLNVMEVPDIVPWVKPHELLLTTGYPLKDSPEALGDLIQQLDDRQLSGIAIKVGRYLDELPTSLLRAADRLAFPVIRLPVDVGFDDILNHVLTEILNRQAATLARSEEIHRAFLQVVLRGGELQEITDQLVTLRGGAAVVVDAEGRPLAVSGDGDLLPRLYKDQPVGDGAQKIDLSRLEPETDDRRGGDDSDILVYASTPVVIGSVVQGAIVLAPPGRPVSAEDSLATEHAATVAALVRSRQIAVGAVESKYQADFLRELLTASREPDPAALAHAASLGWDLERPLVVLVAELDVDNAVSKPIDARVHQTQHLMDWLAAVRALDPQAAVVGFANQVVVVCGIAQGISPAHRLVELRSGVRSVGQRSFSLGVSSRLDGAGRLSRGYQEALEALAVARQRCSRGGSAHFDGLGIYRLLSLVGNREVLSAFVSETLGPLVDATPEMEDLRRTLGVLLDTNLNVAEAARQLHFHYNTMRYRIAKLEQVLGHFTTEPDLRLSLQVALKALDLYDLTPGCVPDQRRIRARAR